MPDQFSIHGTELKIPGTGAFKISVTANLQNPCECKNCGASIFWARTRKNKKNMPIEYRNGEYVCHYNHCESKPF